MARKCKIFYSWQSDIKQSRNFIESALKAVKPKDVGVEVVELDRDTRGLPGAPKIEDVIMEKIRTCDIFVADVTIINPKFWNRRKTPNPNVLIELGCAIAALGWERIVPVYCCDYGTEKDLPFDINHQRLVSFSLKGTKKADEKKKLSSNIAETIRLLNEQGKLHGGTPGTVQNRQYLATFIERSLRKLVYGGKIIASDSHLEKLESLVNTIEPGRYEFLHQLISDIISGTRDTEDGHITLWNVVEYSVHSLLLNYKNAMPELPVNVLMNQECYEAYSCLLPEKDRKPYITLHEINGYRLSLGLDDIEIHAKDGTLLCKGSIKAGLFTGFKIENDYHHYEGNYLNGKRHGEGVGYDFHIGEAHVPAFRGTWSEDKLVDGMVHSFVIPVENGERVIPELLTYADCKNKTIQHGVPANIYNTVLIADVEFKDGVGRILEDTVETYSSDEDDEFEESDESLEEIAIRRAAKYGLTVSNTPKTGRF